MKKKIVLFTVIIFGCIQLSAQTNTFPASGNVGIGTLAPADKLTVLTASNVVGITHSNGAVRISTVINNTGGYLGTATNHPLFFRTNNNGSQVTLLQSGNLGIATLTPRSKLEVYGADAYINTVRVGIGGITGDTSTGNTCLGKDALLNNADFALEGAAPWEGNFNTGIGRDALKENWRGGYNTAVGSYALSEAVYSDGNTAVGCYSQKNNKGQFNTSVGMTSLWTNTEGDYNSAFGYSSLESNTTGSSNTAMGRYSLQKNTTADYNTAVGTYAMNLNTTGTLNTAVGYRSLDSNTTGQNNTANGVEALYRNRTGVSNTAMGNEAMRTNGTGSYNTALGRYSLYYNISGGTNTALGYFASTSIGALNNTTAVGYNARTTASNQVRLGNNVVTSIGGYAGWTNISDGRVKKNIKENVPGLTFINQLKPVTYNLNLAAADKIINEASMPEKLNDKETTEAATARTVKEKIVYTGFIAQEVEKAAKESGYDFSGVDAPKNNNDLYGLRYAEFVVPLVKSVQELSRLNEEKDARINSLQQQIDELKELVTGKKAVPQNESLTSASLAQNSPNPFSNATTIRYTLPVNYLSAKIIITDNTGKLVKEIAVTGKGNGSVNINAASLNAGTYRYSLYVNDHLSDSKQMVLTK